jgi:hypothetical protein
MRSIIIVSILSSGAATLAAQTPVPVQVPQETLRQVQGFENNLRTAIERAGGQVADWARGIVPDINLRLESQPRVTGIVLPEGEGMLFLVEVPGIEGTSVQLWDLSRRMAQSATNPLARGGDPVRPVTSTAPATAPPATVAAFNANPEQQYSDLTRQALVDAMLDYANALPIREGQLLTLSVGVASTEPANPLAAIPRRLYLRLKGEDLVALRQNRISRDEARARIREFRY